MRKLLEYVLALTHLYGLVHKDKVVEIYNKQNDDRVDEDAVNEILEQGVNEGFVGTHGDYFVHETILERNTFDRELAERKGKPFYVPDQDELLKYVSDYYYERSQQYKALEDYAEKHLFNGDERQAENLADEIQGVCQFGFSVQTAMDVISERKVNFKNEQQLSEVMHLIMDLANNVRLWENNGHTPSEIHEKMGGSHSRPLPAGGFPGFGDKPNLSVIPGGATKVGRNEPCPCGSGKKYKKCCLGKEE